MLYEDFIKHLSRFDINSSGHRNNQCLFSINCILMCIVFTVLRVDRMMAGGYQNDLIEQVLESTVSTRTTVSKDDNFIF